METPSLTSGPCARCKKAIAKKCSGCSGAPKYDEDLPQPNFYCSSECQKKDWDTHKARCKVLQTRKSLVRAAFLLQAIFYKIRLHASPLTFTTARAVGSTLYFENYKGQVPEVERQLKPFSVDVKGDQAAFDATVVYNGCMEAMVYLYGFAAQLVISLDLCYGLEELLVGVINNKLSIVPLIPNSGGESGRCSGHKVYRFTMSNGEFWVIDPTAAQYGFSDPICPWSEFAKHRLGKIHREFHFGFFRDTLRLDYGLILRDNSYVVEQTENLEFALALEEKIPGLAKAYGGDLKSILKLSDAAFVKAKDELLALLEPLILVSLEEIYKPDRVMRRRIGVARQLQKMEKERHM